jgi:hypothetical protein
MCSKPAAKHRCLTVRCACVSCSCRLVWWLWLLDGHIPPGESTRVLCCHTVCALLVWAVHARAASVVGMYLKQGWSHSCSYRQYSMTTSVGTGSAVLQHIDLSLFSSQHQHSASDMCVCHNCDIVPCRPCGGTALAAVCRTPCNVPQPWARQGLGMHQRMGRVWGPRWRLCSSSTA